MAKPQLKPYQVVTANSPAALAEMVLSQLALGYVVAGGVIFAPTYRGSLWAQALISKE
jgi:hypothetical protein